MQDIFFSKQRFLIISFYLSYRKRSAACDTGQTTPPLPSPTLFSLCSSSLSDQIKMADCGGFGSIDFLVKATGLSDPGLRLVLGLFSGMFSSIMLFLMDVNFLELS